MVDPVLTPLAVLGVAGWFGNKVLGPPADAVGAELAKFVTARTHKIFAKAERKEEPADPKPLPAGFLYLATQKASFSEDSEILTDMWASLLVDASAGLNHNHAVFADILTQIGSDGAQFLRDLVGSSDWEIDLGDDVGLTDAVYNMFRSTLIWKDLEQDQALIAANALLNQEVGWPVLTKMASYTYNKRENNPAATGTIKVFGARPDPVMIDVLSRQRLVTEFDFDFQPGWASPRLAGVYLTMLGLDLVRTCSKPDVR